MGLFGRNKKTGFEKDMKDLARSTNNHNSQVMKNIREQIQEQAKEDAKNNNE